MNFRNLHYFLAVAEEKNITHAAQKLYISQQSLSSHIARLEEELGVSLFERTPELKLTYAGDRLLLLARRVCELEQDILRETGEISDSRRGRIRLGISYTCGRAILPDILPEFCAGHPLVEISLMEGNYSQLNDWMSKGEIDVLIGYVPIDVPGAKVFPLLQERLFLTCPKAFGLSDPVKSENGFPELDIHAFQDIPFILLKKGNRIREMLDAYTARAGFFPNILLEMENLETAFALSRQGMGITVYPELFLHTLHLSAFEKDSPLAPYPLPGPETVGGLAIAIMENGYHSPAVLDFVSLCKRQAASWQNPV